ncbi:MAG: UDP-N-acetylmuramate:L-alanyl-gamma-D-glutamyl-meso-diaminopimelate ligase [Gammaproteobacteria bacterium]|nr:UDP-N-acetylmuramate:L-alanyl-gamma-D-glutamyl-meso-diaminopimelate ligase [Gammaproteobacteria bacterium]
MRIHILGIGGTFMAAVALLARELGCEVSGSDGPLYPPMSDVLADAGIEVNEGYLSEHLKPAPDLVVVGNIIARGNPAAEYMLDKELPYVSGPEFVAVHVLVGRKVIAVAGTHGKTTTTSLIAWLLEATGQRPGFLIGGLPENFPVTARLGKGDPFVIEADEYETAFFDRRPKFIHYHPHVLVLNNLEFDHADIYADLAAIEKQFHYLLCTVPGSGRIIANGADAALARVIAAGAWTPVEYFGSGSGSDLAGQLIASNRFELWVGGKPLTTIEWQMRGAHNMENALAALGAVRAAGVPLEAAIEALPGFAGVRRRLTLLADTNGVRLYDDFAHHPTAISRTLQGLKQPGRRLIAVLEPRSNTMRRGDNAERLAAALEPADRVFLLVSKGLGWSPASVLAPLGKKLTLEARVEELAERIAGDLREGDDVVLMSNGSFDGLAGILEKELEG